MRIETATIGSKILQASKRIEMVLPSPSQNIVAREGEQGLSRISGISVTKFGWLLFRLKWTEHRRGNCRPATNL